MVVANLYTNPVFVGLVLAVPSTVLGYFGFKHSQKQDAIATQAGIATAESGTIGQVIDGLNKLAEGNRAALEDCRRELTDLSSRYPRAPDQT